MCYSESAVDQAPPTPGTAPNRTVDGIRSGMRDVYYGDNVENELAKKSGGSSSTSDFSSVRSRESTACGNDLEERLFDCGGISRHDRPLQPVAPCVRLLGNECQEWRGQRTGEISTVKVSPEKCAVVENDAAFSGCTGARQLRRNYPAGDPLPFKSSVQPVHSFSDFGAVQNEAQPVQSSLFLPQLPDAHANPGRTQAGESDNRRRDLGEMDRRFRELGNVSQWELGGDLEGFLREVIPFLKDSKLEPLPSPEYATLFLDDRGRFLANFDDKEIVHFFGDNLETGIENFVKGSKEGFFLTGTLVDSNSGEVTKDTLGLGGCHLVISIKCNMFTCRKDALDYVNREIERFPSIKNKTLARQNAEKEFPTTYNKYSQIEVCVLDDSSVCLQYYSADRDMKRVEEMKADMRKYGLSG